MKGIHNRPPRMIPFQNYGQPIWFVTLGTYDRKPVLSDNSVHLNFRCFAEKQISTGIAIGGYVLMPDHIHLFMRLAPNCSLGCTIGFLKKALSPAIKKRGFEQPYWQPGFFDHLVRNAEGYSAKWEYVRQNPVRGGFVQSAALWPYAGEIVPLRV